jgi:rRNA maturation RNase YbeY
MQFPAIPLDDLPDQPVSFHFEDVTFDLPDEAFITQWLLAVAREEGKTFLEVNYIFCSDEYLRQVNVEYLEHDYYTDIITFPYSLTEIHGDVFISSERVADNAGINKVSFEDELCRVMVHGVLHLSGYPDKKPEEAAIMRSKEDYYLGRRTVDAGRRTTCR